MVIWLAAGDLPESAELVGNGGGREGDKMIGERRLLCLPACGGPNSLLVATHEERKEQPRRHPGVLVLPTLEEPAMKINNDRFQPENKSRLLLALSLC